MLFYRDGLDLLFEQRVIGELGLAAVVSGRRRKTITCRVGPSSVDKPYETPKRQVIPSTQQFFHVDRRRALRAGLAEIQGDPQDMNLGVLRKVFPSGLSAWGHSMLDNSAVAITASGLAVHGLATITSDGGPS